MKLDVVENGCKEVQLKGANLLLWNNVRNKSDVMLIRGVEAFLAVD